MTKALIAGVGMIPFAKPGQSADWDVIAGARQVEDLNFGLQHNLGLGGACVVTLYGAPEPPCVQFATSGAVAPSRPRPRAR